MSAHVKSIGSVLPLLAGPLIWAAHLFMLYLVESYACPGIDTGIVRSVGAGGTLLALAAAGFAAWMFSRSPPQEYGKGVLATAFALPLSMLSAVAIVWAALPAILLPACAPAIG